MVLKGRHLVAAGGAGLVLGLLCALGTHALADATTDPYGQNRPGAAQWSCADGSVVAAAVLEDGVVQVSVTVRDEQARDWQVRVAGDGGTLRPTADGGYPAHWTQTADLDDGPTRVVRARPAGTQQWCSGSVSLTWD
jgi:hypothetical protein